MIWFACKQCGKRHGRGEHLAGTLVFCECGHGNRVPWSSTIPEPAPEPPPPREPRRRPGPPVDDWSPRWTNPPDPEVEDRDHPAPPRETGDLPLRRKQTR